ncbi:hypothetical protein [Streptosporangium sandarakinum]|uniref:hypothetical protein n=1 Tax=Streptosporangium sandarakinum TaxID=1260955 RepID=UPI00371F603E
MRKAGPVLLSVRACSVMSGVAARRASAYGRAPLQPLVAGAASRIVPRLAEKNSRRLRNPLRQGSEIRTCP